MVVDTYQIRTCVPNKEIIEEFENAMSVGGWSNVVGILKEFEKMLEDTLRCDENSVVAALDKEHTEVAFILTYDNENSQSLANDLLDKDLVAAIGLAYNNARKDYRLIRAFPTGKGYADIAFLPLLYTGKPALVMELKYDMSVSF